MEAVAKARQSSEPVKAAQQLDRYLRARLLEFLQSRRGDRDELEEAFMAARTWAVRTVTDYRQRWEIFLEILSDSEQVESAVEQIKLLTDRESEILLEILDSEQMFELRPSDLAKRLKLSDQNVNNYVRRLERAGLVTRQRLKKRGLTFISPTARAFELADQLKLRMEPSREEQKEQEPDASVVCINKRKPINTWPGLAA